MPSKSSNRLSQEYVTPPLPVENLIMLPLWLFDKSMERLRSSKDQSAGLQTIGWSFISIGGSAFLSACAYWGSVKFVEKDVQGNQILMTGSWVILFFTISVGALGLIAGWVALHYSKLHKKDRADLLEFVLEDLQDHRDRQYPRVHESSEREERDDGGTARVG